MSFSHMLILAAVAVIVIPPDKLPEVARQLARFINDLKRSTSGIWDDLKQEALLKPEDLLRHQQVMKNKTTDAGVNAGAPPAAQAVTPNATHKEEAVAAESAPAAPSERKDEHHE
jgi:sec-independent protein translocase protein TatB